MALLDDKQNGNIELKTTTAPIANLRDSPQLTPSVTPGPAVSLESGGTTVRIDVSGMPAGSYTLSIPFEWDNPSGDRKGGWLVKFRVRLSPPK